MLEHMKGATVAGRQRWPKFRSGAEALLSYEMGVWLQLSAPLRGKRSNGGVIFARIIGD